MGSSRDRLRHLNAVIMAGGRGERFWPLSTDCRTKPFLSLLGERTLIRETVDRLIPWIPAERIWISIGRIHLDLARAQLPEIPPENFIVEPVGRDTAPCLGFSALHLQARDPDSRMLAIPADQFVDSGESYRRTLQKGIDALEGATAVIFGIVPTRPDTGYGYIHARRPGDPGAPWQVLRFVEKPDSTGAEAYLRSGEYFWNSGMFLWSSRILLQLFERHLPGTYRGLLELRPLIGDPDRGADLLRIFSSLERISVDYGIMQKATALRMIPAEFGWDDIGSWAALTRALPADADGNLFRGSSVSLDSERCTVYSDAGMVATYGVSDLIVVHANGKVLVCPRHRAGELKRLVAEVERSRT